MTRMVKDFIEIKDHISLDGLIERLLAVRESLPNAGEAEIKMRGDDIFGRQLTISYFRPQTAEEAECDARYAATHRQARDMQQRRSGKLRIVA
jgi:hypothetical protein